MDDDGRSRSAPSSPGGGPRLPVIATYKETVRCDGCGGELTTLFEVERDSVCPKCEAPLHSCRNCYNFDPSARFECTEEIPKRITKKSAANDCDFYKVRTIRVKDLSPPAPAGPDQARKALEDLFKKK